MKTFSKLLNPNRVDNFNQRISDTLGIFQRTVKELQLINGDISQAIDNNEDEIEELNRKKAILEDEIEVFEAQAGANGKKIDQITKFLKL